jgi:protein KTI12
VPKAPSDALHTLEQTTASTVSAFMRAQELTQGCGGPTVLTISATLERRMVLPMRNVTLSELQRLKRQFVTVHKKAITLGTTEKGAIDWSEENIAEKFVAYLTENLKD